MKKYYLLLAGLAILLGYIVKTNYWFEDERDIYFPITKEQLKLKKQVAADQLRPHRNAL